MLFVFPMEAVAEIRNATVQAFLATALHPRDDGYDVYWAIYVKPVSVLTPFYMAVIDPFRRHFVYPALIRQTEEAWRRAYPAGRGPAIRGRPARATRAPCIDAALAPVA